jgi:branched-chain amino acid transport system substrate-binding protein
MTRRLIRTTAAISAVVLAVGATACGSDDQRSAGGGAAKQTVKVGGLFDLSGPTADVSTPYSEGIKGFVTSWNDKGDGPTIELSSVDYKYDVAVAERLYSRQKADGVVAVQGWGTGDTEALRGKVTADKVPFMSASYAETLTDPAQTPFNFVTATSYSDQMRLALKWISEQSKGAQVASFHHDSPFGESPQKAGATKAKELGLGFETYAMPAEATDYVPQLRRAKAQGAKFVVIQNVSTPAAQLAKNIAEQGLDMKVVCLNWCGDELFVDLAGKAAQGTVGVMPFAPASVNAAGLAAPRDFLEKSGGNLDKQGLHYVQGWYTMALMAEGIKRAADKGTVTGESIKQALEEMEVFDTGGVSAPVDFSAASHAGMKGSKLYEVKDGKWMQLTDLLNAS